MCRNMLLSTEKKLEPGLEDWKVTVAVPKKSPCSRSMLSRAWRVSRCHLSLHLASPQQFARCQWQTSSGPSRTYLVYRWCLPIVLLSIAVTSFAMQRIHHPPGYQGPMVELNYFKWFIYLTNWGFMLCVLQAVLALAVVQRSWLRRSHSISCECGDGEQPEHSPLPELPYQGRTPLLCRVYWVTQTVATDLAFVVSLVYWTQVHDSNIHEVNALNVLVHICNSLVMLMEILMTSHPVRPLHVVYTITVGTIYGAFSAVYYLAGGTDRMNEATIYPSLDWRVPAKALTFIALCACVMCVAHAVATLAFFIRTRISARCRAVQEPPPLVAGKLIALTSVE